MLMIRAAIDRLFYDSVDAITASVKKTVTRLERLSQLKDAEAAAQQRILSAAGVARDLAKAESARALATRAKFNELLGS